ncbi:MAG: aspartate 1-decarboxylase [Kiritimatiellae bacterium]|nr:aspartate 1-decarboxylase [Kiritimatiellia bacterium]
MLSFFLKSKLHHLRVTEAQLEYQGSMTLDPDFLDAAGISQYEKILVANLENGERFETYAIAGARGSKVCCLNGATAHKGAPGDRVIVFTFCALTEDEAAVHKPRIVVFDGVSNTPVRSSGI